MHIESDLFCMSCGNVFSIPRQRETLRKHAHIKDMYCFCCKKVTKQLEIYDVSLKFLSEKIANNLFLTQQERKIIRVLQDNDALILLFDKSNEEQVKKRRLEN